MTGATTRATYVPARINERQERLDQDLELVRVHWFAGATDRKRTAVLFWAALTAAAADIERLEQFLAAEPAA